MSATPGLWKFEIKWCDQVTSDDGCIAVLADYRATGETRTIKERRDNGKLMAAAPRLLAALEALADQMSHIKVTTLFPTLKEAREAIEEAKGTPS